MGNEKYLTLTGLKEIVDRYVEMRQGREIMVCIPNNKGGMGGTSVTYAIGANGGIDWDGGKFFIQPEVKMIERHPDFTETKFQEALQRIKSLETIVEKFLHDTEGDQKFLPATIRFAKTAMERFKKTPIK